MCNTCIMHKQILTCLKEHVSKLHSAFPIPMLQNWGTRGACIDRLMVRVVLVTKMVDMDQVTRAKQAGCMQADGTVSDPSAIPPRRDGLFQATFGACAFLGSAWAGLFPILINVLGYESKRRDTIPPQEQEGRVRYATFIVIAALCPALQLVYSMIMWNFPLHGETLDQLSQDYSALFVGMKTEDSSKVVKKPEAVAPPPAEHVGS